MRILILMMLVFASCKKIVTPSMEQDTVTDLCETEFQEFLQDSLKYLDIPAWSPYVVILRDDQFVEALKTEYISCIKGKTENDILQLFGKPRAGRDSGNDALTYDCAPKNYHETKRGDMCLIFRFDENDLVKYISYYRCWETID